MALTLNDLRHFLGAAGPFDVVCICLLIILAFQVPRLFRTKSTALLGPPPDSRLYGLSETLFKSKDTSVLYEDWVQKYGSVFRLPLALGSSRIVLCDPKAAAHFYSRETTVFLAPKLTKVFVERLFGKGLIWAEGESHKRQRKALSPAFSVQAIRSLTTVFFDSVYKLKTTWDTTLDAASDGEALIDVQVWMNKVSLDTIGIAGFSHDFGTLDGRKSTVAEVFDSFTQIKPKSFSSLHTFLTPVLPFLLKIPNGRMRAVEKLNEAMEKISDDLLVRTRQEKGADRARTGKGPKSIIEALILAEDAQSELTLSQTEVLAQMKTLMLAGYETTSISLTWALINLALNPGIQNTLRAELLQLNTDPTFEQLTNSLPYLDAISKETFRLHPPVAETVRVAATDDVIPLGVPVTKPDGEIVDRIHVAAGTTVSAPIRLLNRSKAIWGDNAHEFLPSRWEKSEAGLPERAREIHGFSHILTFVDGPRTCLGKQFAITEFKAVLSTLIRNYEFRLPGGVDTKFEKVLGVLPRPRVVGEEGSRVPMVVKRIE